MVRRQRGPRGDVDRARIVQAATRVVARDGAAGLSLRAVAAEADISPNAIYTYVADMRDLANSVADDYIGTWDLGVLRSAEPARQAAARFVAHVWEQFVAHPGQADLLARYRIVGPNALALQEALLTFFTTRAGMGLKEAGSATYLLTTWLHGRALLRASDAEEIPPALLEGIELDDYPLTLAASRLPADDLDELDLLLDALGLGS